MIDQNSNNWDKYKRKQVNISKAIYNPIVSQYLTRHHKYLYSLLVKSEQDRDTFNDTYLKITYCYNPEKDFVQQYIYYFNLLKGAYYRDDRVSNYYLSLDSVEAASVIDDSDDTPAEKSDQTLATLKQNLQSYANFKKSQKRASKENQQR